MPFKSLQDFAEVADYQKNLLAGLKASESKAAKLHYFENFAFKTTKGPLLFVGPVESKLVEVVKSSGAKLRAVGSVMQTDAAIRYKAPGVKEDVLTKALRAAKIQKDAVAVEDLSDADDVPASKPGADATPVAPGEAKKALEQRLAELTKDFARMVNRASENYRVRLKANKDDCEKLVAGPDAKQAAKALAGFAQVAEDSDKVFASMRDALLNRAKALEDRMAAIQKPPLSPKHKADGRDRIDRVRALMAGNGAEEINWTFQAESLATLEKSIDRWEDLGESFADQKSAFDALATQVDALITGTKAGVVRLDKTKKAAYADLIKELDQKKKKLPAVIDDAVKDPFADASGTYARMRDWLMSNMVDTGGGGSGDPVIERMKRFKHTDPRTWDVTTVRYLNGTSAGAIGSHASSLESCSLRSRTTASGSVLKVNFEGHEHLEGGSGGFAFVYKLNADYTVTPTCVDISDKRGGKNGNQYMWRTGGSWAYFPPNAAY